VTSKTGIGSSPYELLRGGEITSNLFGAPLFLCYNVNNYNLLKNPPVTNFKNKTMSELFKKYIGGMAFMFSILFLLIGLTKYDEILSSTSNDFSHGTAYIKTVIFQGDTNKPLKKPKFEIDNDGEIMKIVEIADGVITYHYRSLFIPELKNNYALIPLLELEVIVDGEKEFIPKEIYKIDREKGLIFFLLKIEKNNQIAMKYLYTGNYKLSFVD
jgi:Na+-transporting methylmalonyl-CoA/oxaloacetate decarboxylase gamma subunit